MFRKLFKKRPTYEIRIGIIDCELTLVHDETSITAFLEPSQEDKKWFEKDEYREISKYLSSRKVRHEKVTELTKVGHTPVTTKIKLLISTTDILKDRILRTLK